MIYIQEILEDGNEATIRLDGRVDRKSLASLKEVCDQHLGRDRRVRLQLTGLNHICKEGRYYLREIQDRVTFVDLPHFLKLEIED